MNIKERICQNCNKPYVPNGNTQKYCPECRVLMSKKYKSDYYVKNNPNAYSLKDNKVCCICGNKFSSTFDGKPYCNMHYLRMYANGSPNLLKHTSNNTYIIKNEIAYVKTTKGTEFIIDASCLDNVMKYTWCLSKTGYLVANVKGKVTKLHRYLLNVSNPSDVIDHINHNKLDNRLSNLRICTQSINGKNLPLKKNNTSGYSGIDITKHNKYRARITVDGKEVRLGNYSTLDMAIKSRQDAEEKYFKK